MSSWTPPSPPAWVRDLLSRVDRAFATTGAGTPGWPDPRQGRPPAEEEYSRCLDPAKYRILDTRVEAWAQALGELGIAVTRDVAVTGPVWLGALRPAGQHHRVQQVEPAAPGGLTLLFAHTIVDGAPFGLDVGVRMPTDAAAPPVLTDSIPVCGCDACDDGSETLLEQLDGWFVTAATGGVVHARQGERQVTRTGGGWSSTGDTDESWLDASAPTPPGLRRWSGDPWL